MSSNWVKVCLFAGGALFGSAGIKLLSSRDAKKAYTHVTAAVLRMRGCVMDTAQTLQENCEDIYQDAVKINEERQSREAQPFEGLSQDEAQAGEACAQAPEAAAGEA